MNHDKITSIRYVIHLQKAKIPDLDDFEVCKLYTNCFFKGD